MPKNLMFFETCRTMLKAYECLYNHVEPVTQ
jgi:hypothetical protein